MNPSPLHRPIRAYALLLGVLLKTVSTAHAEPVPGYDMGFRNVTNLQADLYLALDRKKRPLVSSQAVLLTGVRQPCVGSVPAGGGGAPIQVSAGFIDFLNRVAHAKAIDQTERGVFGNYTRQVAQQTRNSPLPDFDARSSPAAWTLDTMNQQASQFNQMAAAFVAIELAHHYQGNYRKHAAELTAEGGFPMPINAVVTESEWRDAVMRGARNALDCGLGVEGLKTVFQCFEQMPSRPAWAIYFVHPKTNLTKISAELGKLERDFFVMNHQLQKFGGGR
jgi:hypothetical protein